RAFLLTILVLLLTSFSPLLSASVEATQGQLSSQPVGLRFHQVVVGQNESISVTLMNTGAGSVTISRVQQNTSVFQVKGLKLPITLKVGGSVKFEVRFEPQALGHVDDEIGFVNDGVASPYYLHAHGSGVPVGSLITDSPAIDFGNIQVGNNQI